MLQAFLFIVTLPLTNVFCHSQILTSNYGGFRHILASWQAIIKCTVFLTYQALQKPTESQHIPTPLWVRGWVGGSQFVCLQVVWGALNYCKNHNILFHVPSEISSWSAGSDLQTSPSIVVLGCLFKDGPGCDKLTRGHENPATFSWMFQHLFGTENPKPPRCISSICAERFQKLTLTQRRSPSWKQTKKGAQNQIPQLGNQASGGRWKVPRLSFLLHLIFLHLFAYWTCQHSNISWGTLKWQKKTVPSSTDIFQIYSEVSLANNFQDTRTCP